MQISYNYESQHGAVANVKPLFEGTIHPHQMSIKLSDLSNEGFGEVFFAVSAESEKALFVNIGEEIHRFYKEGGLNIREINSFQVFMIEVFHVLDPEARDKKFRDGRFLGHRSYFRTAAISSFTVESTA
jgi:hypothetical protein